MGRAKAPLPALLATLAVSLALAACGSEEPDLLPGETAADIKANLSVVRELSDAGDCVGAENAAAAVTEQIEALEGVDAELKQALVNGANRLNTVVAECASAEEEAEEGDAEAEREAEEGEEAEREAEERDTEREAEQEQKQQEREERDTEREEKEQKEPEPKPDPEPETPNEPEEGGGTPSGGVSPGSPAEG